MNMQDLNRFIPFTGFALSLSIGIVGLVAFIFWRKNTAVQIQSHTDETRNRKAGAGSSQKRRQRDTI